MTKYSLTVSGRRPWTTNQERKRGSHYERSEQTKWWREAFRDAALEANIPHFRAITIEVTPILPDRKIQDTGACYPAAKAAIDGLVDAGVIDDDAPKYVPTITFHSPVLSNYAGLEVLITPEIENE
jgi:crossover junction endodeoxyribonuclease RusA